MRQLLTSILISLVLVAPALACCCPNINTGEDKHHTIGHHHQDNDQQPQPDCYKTDLTLISQVSIQQSTDKEIKQLPTDVTLNQARDAYFSGNQATNADIWVATDPPVTSFPLYLSTQRLRI